jgi:hypothetical protein
VSTLIVVEEVAGPAMVGRGGQAMRVMQVLHALRRRGHDPVFLEFSEEAAEPETLAYFDEVVRGWWDRDRAALLSADEGESLAGITAAAVAELAERAEAVISLSASYRRDPWPVIGGVRPRILWEQDPAYTHLWAAEGEPLDFFGDHDVHFTVGANIGGPRCNVPTLGLDWRPLWPGVLLDWWEPGRPVARDRFTTVAAWRDYGYLEWNGMILGPKVEEWRKFVELPGRAGEPVEVALAIDPEDPDLPWLREHGWELETPAVVRNPDAYRDYVAGSRGEFSCAKGGYVGTRSGWFSDRSACYLAAGRPVVVQATGFEDSLPTGRGLFAVRDVEEAAEAIRTVRGDYELHSRAARDLAAEHFDAERLVGELLAAAGLAASGR